ncbi:MAG: trypsin-like peptidase domain-containing protein [Oscillospiraceae bacterium]|nr:trypsin-like peptidase domain-containing protein [Oscillospiraceae bacterium]
MEREEVRDWTVTGKESFTTPGGSVSYPTGRGGKTYSFTRAPEARNAETPRPEARTASVSPFAREAVTQNVGTQSPPQTAPRPEAVRPAQAAVQQQAVQGAPVVLSHDGESRAYAVPVQGLPPYGPQIYTIQLPSAPRREAPKKRSLWWVPLLVVGALLLGLLGGLVLAPMLGGSTNTKPTETAAPSSENEAARIYRENVDAVVHILANHVADPASGGAAPTASAGTGFLITEDGYLLTNAHVVEKAASVQVTLHGGQQYAAQIVQVEDLQSDLALLKIDATGLQPVTLGSSAGLRVGDQVYTIGNPLGELSFSLTAGFLSAGPRQVSAGGRTLTMLQTNAAFNQGNSGGPLFDTQGKVVGVVTAKLSGSESADSSVEGLGFALPIDELLDTVNAWLSAARSNGAKTME